MNVEFAGRAWQCKYITRCTRGHAVAGLCSSRSALFEMVDVMCAEPVVAGFSPRSTQLETNAG
jgi:hypothetical protein